MLDERDLVNYHTISNLLFLGQLIEQSLLIQFPAKKALVTTLQLHLDPGMLALLTLLDLSADFDPVECLVLVNA